MLEPPLLPHVRNRSATGNRLTMTSSSQLMINYLQRHAGVARSLGDSWASCLKYVLFVRFHLAALVCPSLSCRLSNQSNSFSLASFFSCFAYPHHVSGINFLILSVNLFQSLCLWLPCWCSCHIFLLSQLTTLIIHNSLSLSLPAQDLPFFTNLSHHRLPSGLRTDSTALWLVRFFLASRFFIFSFLH